MSGQTNVPLPGFWRFVWLFFMQPITLHRLLLGLAVDPNASGWKLLRKRRSSYENWWLIRSWQALFLLTPGGALVAAGVLAACGWRFDWRGLAVGIVLGLAVGVADGVTFELALGVAVGAALGIAGGVALGLTAGLALGMAVGVALGVAVSAAGGVVLGVAGGIAVGVAFLLAWLRLPILVPETIVQVATRRWNALTGRSTLVWSPVLYHELSYFLHPFLAGHILAEANENPALVRRVLEACSVAPGQRRIGLRAEATLHARELVRLAKAADFPAIEELRGTWLPRSGGVSHAAGLPRGRALSGSRAGCIQPASYAEASRGLCFTAKRD